MTYGTRSIDDFLSAVASERVTPAGGTVAAVVGAAGAALCEMVCIHADDPATELAGVGEDLGRHRHRLRELADADADAVEAYRAATGDATRETRRAVGVPLAAAEACGAVVDAGATTVARGNESAVPDAVTGVTLAEAAMRASAFTVRANLRWVDDPDFEERIRGRVAAIERATGDAHDRALGAAADRLGLDP